MWPCLTVGNAHLLLQLLSHQSGMNASTRQVELQQWLKQLIVLEYCWVKDYIAKMSQSVNHETSCLSKVMQILSFNTSSWITECKLTNYFLPLLLAFVFNVNRYNYYLLLHQMTLQLSCWICLFVPAPMWWKKHQGGHAIFFPLSGVMLWCVSKLRTFAC